MNKWILAAIFGAVVFVAGVGPSLEASTLSPTVIVSAVAAAALAALGKVMDPNSIIELPPWATALALAFATVAPMVGNAFTDGTYVSLQTWAGIGVAFITALWGKWSMPSKVFTFGHPLSPRALGLRRELQG